MLTLQMIKEELSDIRYYYARREMFDKAFDCVGKNAMAVISSVQGRRELLPYFLPPNQKRRRLCPLKNAKFIRMALTTSPSRTPPAPIVRAHKEKKRSYLYKHRRRKSMSRERTIKNQMQQTIAAHNVL